MKDSGEEEKLRTGEEKLRKGGEITKGIHREELREDQGHREIRSDEREGNKGEEIMKVTRTGKEITKETKRAKEIMKETTR